MTKLAAATIGISPSSKEENLETFSKYINEAGSQDVDVIVFPELSLGGPPMNPMQVYTSDAAAYQHSVAELIPEGPSVLHLIEMAKEHELYICWSMSERSHERFDVCYNTCVLVGPEGFIGKYRKAHQPLTERLTFYPGSGDYPVYDTRIGKVGLSICYDKCYPEVARILALKGAQVILSPTLWPCITKSEDDPDFKASNVFSYARALENMVFYVESNSRWSDKEPMMGHSRIIGPNPMQICATTGFDEGMAVADVDIEAEILKARLYSMGGSDLLKDRKPTTYFELNKPNKWNPISGDIGQREREPF